jgi:hypothetical protein
MRTELLAKLNNRVTKILKIASINRLKRSNQSKTAQVGNIIGRIFKGIDYYLRESILIPVIGTPFTLNLRKYRYTN